MLFWKEGGRWRCPGGHLSPDDVVWLSEALARFGSGEGGLLSGCTWSQVWCDVYNGSLDQHTRATPLVPFEAIFAGKLFTTVAFVFLPPVDCKIVSSEAPLPGKNSVSVRTLEFFFLGHGILSNLNVLIHFDVINHYMIVDTAPDNRICTQLTFRPCAIGDMSSVWGTPICAVCSGYEQKLVMIL